MANELERLSLQYGVGSPTTGSAPSPPSTLVAGATPDQIAKYNTDLATYNTNLQAYKNYANEYNARTANTDQYLQSQYKTGLEPVSVGKKTALASPAGISGLNANITDWAKQNPNATTADVNAMAANYGVNAQDIYDATNNRWANVLNVPIYGKYFPPVINTVKDPVTDTTTDTVTTPIIPVTEPVVTPPVVTPPVVQPLVVETVTDPSEAIVKGPTVTVENLKDEYGNDIPDQPMVNQPLTPASTISAIKNAATSGESSESIAHAIGVTPDVVNVILNPTADAYQGFYDKTFGNTTKQDFSTDLKNAFDYKVGINNNYQPVSTENSPLANIALGLANGYLGAADYIVAGVKSLLGSQTFAQELAHGKTEATNFKAESPISSLASTLIGQLAGAAVGGPSGAKSVVDLGKTVYDFLTGGYTATPSSLASERALGNKIDSTGYLQIDPKVQASIDAVSRMTNPVTGAAYGNYKYDPTLWDSITKGAGTIWDNITGSISDFVSPVTDVITGGGSTTTPTYQPPLTNTQIGNNFWNNGGGSSFNADYALGNAYSMPDFYTPAPDYFDYSSISNLSPETQYQLFQNARAANPNIPNAAMETVIGINKHKADYQNSNNNYFRNLYNDPSIVTMMDSDGNPQPVSRNLNVEHLMNVTGYTLDDIYKYFPQA